MKTKVADYVIQWLADRGFEKVFLVYGSAIADLVDAFHRVKNIEHICVIHEQAGAFAAETYAKVAGSYSCIIATSAPGAINLMNGIANAYYDSVPCLFITGQVNTRFMKKSNELRQVGFQENDTVSMAKPITKMAEMLNKPEDVKYLLEKALYTMYEGRPGAVLLDMPMDILRSTVETKELRSFEKPQVKWITSKVIAEIHALIRDFKKYKRPVILVGGGIRSADAVSNINILASMLKIPCLPTWNAIDIITNDSPYYAGRVGTYGGDGRNFTIQNSDLLLSIGCRISGRITGGNIASFARGAKKYIVDVDRALLKPELQEVKGDVNIPCDARLFINKLIELIKEEQLPDWSWWLNKAIEWKNKYNIMREHSEPVDYVNPYMLVKVLSEELEPCDIVVSDCGGNAVVTYQAFESKFGQRVVSSHGNSPMGYAFAGAMGAALLPERVAIQTGYKPIKRVVCIIGDGGFNMNIQDLQTVKNYKADKLKVFIMNNHCYGITRQFEATNYGGRFIACGKEGYNPPDFVKVVDAYGIKTETIKNHEELRNKVRYVLNYPEAIVCDVDCGMWMDYNPRISGWRTPIEDMYPWLPREEFKENMIIEPLEGWDNEVPYS